MSERVTWLLCIALALGIVDGTLVWLDRRSEARSVPTSGALVEYESAGIARITIARGGKTLVATRTGPGQGWQVTSSRGYPAHAPKVEGLLERVRGWRRGRVAGERANHQAFQVTRELGLSIKLEDFSDRVVADLVMGGLTGLDPEKARQTGGNVDPKDVGRYVRLEGDDTVYVIDDFVISDFEPDPRDWLERPLLGVSDETRVRAYSVKSATGQAIAVFLDGAYPRLADERPVDPDKAWAVANELTRAFALDVAREQDEAKLGLAPARLVAEVAFKDGAQARLSLGDAAAVASSTEDAVNALVEGKPAPVVVPRAAIATLSSFSLEAIKIERPIGERAMGLATRMMLVQGTDTVTLAKLPSGGWEVAGVSSGVPTPKHGIDEAARTRLFAALGKLGVEGFDRGGAHAIGTPTLTVAIELSTHETIELRFGDEPGPADPLPVVWAARTGMPGWALAARVADVRELKAAIAAIPR